MILLNKHLLGLGLAGLILLSVFSVGRATGQESAIRYGRGVPMAVRSINNRALQYLAQTQNEDGSWSGGESGSGILAICVMSFIDSVTGHLTGSGHGSLYHHGFATLALSEAYGLVDDQLLWQSSSVPTERRRTIGQALELAVRCALTAQKKNPWGAWRYSPDSQDADTTVSGTVLMGLLGARNAGIEVPNDVVDKALSFFRTNTMRDGNVSYQPTSSHGDGITRAAIGTLIYAVSKRKDLSEYRATSTFIKRRMDMDTDSHPFYNRYYMAQALFHSDLEAWKSWNRRTIEKLQQMQRDDGSFSSSHGFAYGTGMTVLALALNYRLLPVYER